MAAEMPAPNPFCAGKVPSHTAWATSSPSPRPVCCRAPGSLGPYPSLGLWGPTLARALPGGLWLLARWFR